MEASIFERTRSDDTTSAPGTVLVAGASGGIGRAFCAQLARQFPHIKLIRLARKTTNLPRLPVETIDIAVDLLELNGSDDDSAFTPETDQLALPEQIDWLFIATGWLHDKRFLPEKTYRSLDADHLMHAFQVNTVGPVLLLKQLLKRLDPRHPLRIGVLSARVGSISDNRLGGWHSYRASKAALNMLIKNYAIEFKRLRRPYTICGLQPGTTDTALSAPFQRNVPPDQLQSVDYTAKQLVKVMQSLGEQDSGKLIDFLGVPFDP